MEENETVMVEPAALNADRSVGLALQIWCIASGLAGLAFFFLVESSFVALDMLFSSFLGQSKSPNIFRDQPYIEPMWPRY